MANVNNDTDRVVLASLALLAERPFTIDMNTSMWEFVKLLAAKINRLISEGEEIFFYKDIRINDLRQILYRDNIKPRVQALYAERRSPTTAAPRPTPPPSSPRLVMPMEDLEGWNVIFPESGPNYFWHVASGHTQWHHPEADVPFQVPVQVPSQVPSQVPEATVSAPTCRICLDTQPEIVANCGHALCGRCHNMYHVVRREALCCVCRQPALAWTRLFL